MPGNGLRRWLLVLGDGSRGTTFRLKPYRMQDEKKRSKNLKKQNVGDHLSQELVFKLIHVVLHKGHIPFASQASSWRLCLITFPT